MRKSITVLLAASLAIGAFSAPMADAKKKKKKKKQVIRAAEATYDSPAIGHPNVIVGCIGANGCATFGVGAKERFASFNIVDSSGTPVYGVGGQDLDGDQLADTSFEFCGTTEKPVPVEPGYEINIFLSPVTGADPVCPGVATSGTVEAKFSNKTFKSKF